MPWSASSPARAGQAADWSTSCAMPSRRACSGRSASWRCSRSADSWSRSSSWAAPCGVAAATWLRPRAEPHAAVGVDVEGQLRGPRFRHRAARLVELGREDEQEAAAARADQHHAAGAGVLGPPAKRLDLVGHCAGCPGPLDLPLLVHELAQPLQVALLERPASRPGEPLGPGQVALHLGIARERPLHLVREHVRGRALLAGVEQQEPVAHGFPDLLRKLQAADVDAVVAVERVGAQAPVRGRVLVLLADAALELVDLDRAGGLGQLGRRRLPPRRELERLQDADGVRARRPEPRARRDVGRRGDLERPAVPVPQQRGPEDRVTNLLRGLRLLVLQVLEDVARPEAHARDDVDVLVDRRGDHEAAGAPVVRGQVRSPAAEGHAQGGPCDYDAHRRIVHPGPLHAAPGILWAMRRRLRDLGYAVGRFETGPRNSLVDVAGVRVGHWTLAELHTGVTAVLPHGGNPYAEKVLAACHVLNGYGKAAGLSQLEELGTLESPVLLTSTVSVGPVWEGGLRWLLDLNPEAAIDRDTVNVVVAECFDGWLGDARGLHVRPEHAREAIAAAREDAVAEGAVGAGAGTTCFGFKSGVGCSSRVVGGATLGCLVVSNYGSRRDAQLLLGGGATPGPGP